MTGEPKNEAYLTYWGTSFENVHEIVRSEVRLATVEIRDEAKRTAASAVWIAAGIIGALTAWARGQSPLWTLQSALRISGPKTRATFTFIIELWFGRRATIPADRAPVGKVR